jgi:tRNA(fMet)-specific endonuclease VapC
MYLLDTNIIIFLFKGKYGVAEKIRSVGLEQCFISEITVAELKYGAEKSNNPEYHRRAVTEFINDIQIIPIFDALDFFAKEKTRLEAGGNRIDDFDLLICSTAVVNDLVLVTNNVSHLGRIQGVAIEDWVIRT